MFSNIENLRNGKVEQISAFGTFMFLGEDTGLLTYTGNSLIFPIDPKRAYEIHAIKLVVSLFTNSDTQQYAYPKFEQFNFAVFLNGYLGPASNTRQTMLFKQMLFVTSDGISSSYVFNEPFIMKSNSNKYSNLIIEFEDAGSFFQNLGAMAIPPAAGQVIDIKGGITLEGVSYDLDDYNKQKEFLAGQV